MTSTITRAPNAPTLEPTAPPEGHVQPQILALHPAFGAMYDQGLLQTEMGEHPWRRARFFHLTQLLRATRGVPGATAEAGVFRGLGSYLMCSVLREECPAFDGSTHHMIDSFEGLPECDAEDDGPTAVRGRFNNTSVEHVRRALAAFSGVAVIKGWIPDAFEHLPEQQYRFVHIDVDLYGSTRDSLHYFYPRLSSGGAIVVDDHGPWPNGVWPGCARAVREFCDARNIGYAALDTGNAVILKR